MAEDLLLNLTSNYETSNATTTYPLMHYFWITLDILKVIAMLILVIIDILLILIFLKSKYLLKSTMNKYLLLFLISNFLFVMFYPLSSGYIFDVNPLWETHAYCSAYQMQHSFLFQMFLFGACPGFEWYLTFYKPRWYHKMRNHYSKTILILVLLILMHFSINLSLCFVQIEGHSCKDYGIMATFAVASVLLAALCFFKFAAGPLKEAALDTAYYLSISIYIVMPWIPNFIINMVFYFINEFSLFHRFIVAMNVLADYMAYSTPITVLYVLYRRNKDFRWECKNVCRMDVDSVDTEMNATNDKQ